MTKIQNPRQSRGLPANEISGHVQSQNVESLDTDIISKNGLDVVSHAAAASSTT
jgi:hypothetical protein